MSAHTNDDFLKEIDELLQDGEGLPDGEILGEGVRAKAAAEKPKSGVDALREALAAHDDVEVLRGLCEGGRVPEELRADMWKECLGVSRRPDAIGSWSGPLDSENQSVIHTQCQEQAAKLGLEPGPQQQAVLDMELVITFYCKSRNVRYADDCGWPELLLPLMSLGLSRADLFNCFYAMIAKYIPKDCKENGRPFHLFRLLLLYHDPELCSFLDTKKLAPHTYLQPWLRSVFVSTCGMDVVHVMWDLYLMERDPYLVFFLALVMIINAKELVMEGGEGVGEDKLCGTIGSLPCQLSADDVEDFFSLAQYYASRSPQSFRKDYHSSLFGSGRSLASVATNVSHALCLPISLQELLETSYAESSETGGMRYFVVDCRPVNHFSCGHLPQGYSLDANLLLHSPADFSLAVDRLCSRVKKAGLEGGEHLCFLGSGREQEDQYVNMVVAKFLQKSVPYVSLARGGFLELLVLLGGRVEQVLEDYDGERCRDFYSDSGYISSTRSDTSDSDSEASYHRQRLHERGARLYAQMAAGFKDRSQRFRSKFSRLWPSQNPPAERHVSQSDRPSKRYRNVHADVFVIADEDEDTAEDNSPFSSEDDSSQQMVNISLYSTAPEILHTFPCTEIDIHDASRTSSSHLLLTRDSMLMLRELSDRAGWARVKHRNKLESIIKITAKKKHPDVITFKFGMGSGEEAVITHMLRFSIPNTQKCTSAIKSLIGKLQAQR